MNDIVLEAIALKTFILQVINVTIEERPSVKLIHACSDEFQQRPQQPFDLQFHAEKMTDYLVVMWKYPSPPHCLDTFVIEHSPIIWGDFAPKAETESVNNFHFMPKQRIGWYRIRARNFNGAYGPYSVPIYYGP